MNILSFDIEEWFIESRNLKREEKYQEFDHYLNQILDNLDINNLKATFFCVGKMGELFPEVIKRIEKRGHEIGCHSNIHTWLNKMSEREMQEDTHQAIDSLEQCIGKKVKSYRAPAFTIGETNKWAFDILAECGIERDASIFPASRDYGGFKQFNSKSPCIINYGNTEIKEFPIATTRLLGREIAYSGGGYFRFFPLWFVEREIKKSDYSMTYFHIADFNVAKKNVLSRQAYEDYYKEPGTLRARYTRHFKSTFGKKTAFRRLQQLLQDVEFVNLEQADNLIEWNNTTVIKI